MSGPKISVYTLTGRAREIVREQMRCEQRAAICAAQIQAILKSMSSVNVDFEMYIRNIRLLIKRTGNGEKQLEQILKLEKTFNSDVDEIERELSANTPHVSVNYTVSEQALNEKQTLMKKLETLLTRAEKLKRSIDEAFNNDKNNTDEIQKGIFKDLSRGDERLKVEQGEGSLRLANTRNVKEIEYSIIDDISGIYSFDLYGESGSDNQDIVECRTAITQKLAALQKNEELPVDITEDINRAAERLGTIADIQALRLFNSITLNSIKERIQAYRCELEQKKTAYAELACRYRTLCEMTGSEARELPYSHEAEELLTGEISRLETIAFWEKEQEYIAGCVDQVMSEMGYDLIGERNVTKRSGKRFRNELFSFREGTAVNVTYSSDGQISMELGGIAHEDRVPDGEESMILTRGMEDFCGEFVEFERRLRERGVLVGKRIALSPPSAEYAAIINVDEYDLNDNIQITEMDTITKRRGANRKKTLREE